MENQICPKNCDKNILIVDDDPAIIRALTYVASGYGTVVSVDSGQQAIIKLKEQHFHLIITDYDMKNGNGLFLANFVNESDYLCPIIMITAHGTKDLAINALNKDIFGFLEKPLNITKIKKLIELALIKKAKDDKQSNLAELGESTKTVLEKVTESILNIEATIGSIDKTDDNKIQLNTISEESKKITAAIEKTNLKLNSSILDLETFDFNHSLNLIKNTIAPVLIENKIVLIFSKTTKTTLHGDKNLITHAVLNLINNSVNEISSLKEKWISVDVQEFNGEKKIIVTDSVRTGFFKRFANSSQKISKELSFVINIVKSHGGKFTKTNSKHNQLVIWLPIRPTI